VKLSDVGCSITEIADKQAKYYQKCLTMSIRLGDNRIGEFECKPTWVWHPPRPGSLHGLISMQ